MKRSAIESKRNLSKSGPKKKELSGRESKGKAKKSPLDRTVQRTLLQYVLGAGMATLEECFERDREQLCGGRYQHIEERVAYRAGYTMGQLALGGRKVLVRRPRVRNLEDREVELATWKQFAETDPLDARTYEQMVLGVSTRKYERSLEPMPEEVETSSTSKSAVSRRWVEATEEKLRQMEHRPLNALKLLGLMIDGIHLGGHVILVALGIDEQGKKHVLGLHEGATENAASCTQLLTNLRDRGLPTDKAILVVIDGAKALHKAVKNVWGRLALIQRCQEHKKRNVLDHLPEGMKDPIRMRLQSIYNSTRVAWAESQLRSLAEELARSYPGAAASLLEGLEETLTVMRLHVSEGIAKSLSTTNLIENLMGAIRRTTRNVVRWQDGHMALRWAATALLEAEPRFLALKDARQLGLLKLSLQAHHAAVLQLSQNLDNPSKEAA